ncbi:hypothetical protein Desor_5233 [Desulfosporosinus orientis DSM 765]|uniref:Uncharacterized protein n=1 Tax=Desulfosporosinus orientis (strain ATCC 19365 / DSM 765 / NCIMB 8382 / VKM B-1628 / Singapore I) TaxID=768706 RepID=G7W9Q1_DESOD|nr:TIGR04086 family membrane protein [Desulfosporosinus orientis]AET70617.1 hypothetical protein Desor_5233 [Desulfosporosinus orientis DSM 765]
MGSNILKGITASLLVTFLTLLAGVIWSAMGLGGLSISQLLDVGLIVSCLVGGYRTAKASGSWLMAGTAGAGYVTVGTLLLALFLPIRGLGFIQVLGEGILISLVAGAFGAGKKRYVSGSWGGGRSRYYTPSYAGYGHDEGINNDFEWDTGDDYEPRINSVKSSWIDSSEDDDRMIQEVKGCSEKEERIEWPWDRDNDNKVMTRNSQSISNDLVIWEQREEKAKPWWEE